MEIEYATANFFYSEKELQKMNLPSDKKLPYDLTFQLEELMGPDYTPTPMDKLFQWAMKRLELPFRGVKTRLDRKCEKLPVISVISPQLLRFQAHQPFGLIYAGYERQLSREPFFYNSLDGGEYTLEQAVEGIKSAVPMGGRVDIKTGDILLTLDDGFNFSRHARAVKEGCSFVDGEFYRSGPAAGDVNNTARELTILLDLPWLKENKVEPIIKKDLKYLNPVEAAALTQRIVESYLSDPTPKSDECAI